MGSALDRALHDAGHELAARREEHQDQRDHRDDDTGHDHTTWAQSWTIGYSLTDQLGAYTEWFAILPHSALDARAQHYADGGFTYQFTDDVQWDIRAGVGLNDSADDYFVGTGLSIRWR